jgi:response regulator of citrate/malate metabolism
MQEETKLRIFNIIKNSERILSKSEIARISGLSLATVCKYVDILESEGKVKVQKLGSVDVVLVKNEI